MDVRGASRETACRSPHDGPRAHHQDVLSTPLTHVGQYSIPAISSILRRTRADRQISQKEESLRKGVSFSMPKSARPGRDIFLPEVIFSFSAAPQPEPPASESAGSRRMYGASRETAWRSP